ncbi:MAG: ABC transporter substrate-binding protein [Flavobacteriales bacterium]|nr:ABC transporter substrate-binding protein [Flavobacteriales bacterium]|tara:strand:+ start:27234 stop:28802 length:1569 start_codon:yes stop_codon:yes gene_type:complete
MRWKVGFFVLGLFLSFCGSKYSNDNLSIFKYNESAGINTLDPAFAKDQATVWAVNQLFNGLVQLDSSLIVQPSVAKYWNISPDALVYTFFLRSDVFFHDHSIFKDGKGRKVVAYDFEYSFNRLLDKKLAAPGAWVLSNIKSYSAVNDSTFRVELVKPFPAFLSLLSMQYCSVVPKEIVEGGNFHRRPVGTGPFKFQLWEDGIKLVFRSNPNYFEKEAGKSLPYLDAIAITFVKDKQSAFLQFIQGELDFISGIDASYKDDILTRNGELQDKYKEEVRLQSQPYLNTEYLGFLMENNALPLEVRKAINYGFDRVKMLKYLRNNIGTPATNGFVPVGLPSFSERVVGYGYNPEKARELIKVSGFNTQDEIVLSTTASYLDLCEYIQNSLEQIGLNIKLEVNPASAHREMVANSRLRFFRGSWIADYPDAENYLSLFCSENFSPGGPNYTHFSDINYDMLYEESLSETNDSLRAFLYQRMDSIITENAVFVPLYYDRVLRFSQKEISGFNSNAMNLLDLKRVKKK